MSCRLKNTVDSRCFDFHNTVGSDGYRGCPSIGSRLAVSLHEWIQQVFALAYCLFYGRFIVGVKRVIELLKRDILGNVFVVLVVQECDVIPIPSVIDEILEIRAVISVAAAQR